MHELWIETKNNSWDFIYEEDFYQSKLFKRYVKKRELELKEYVDRIFGEQDFGLVQSINGLILNELNNYQYNEQQTFPFKKVFLEADKQKMQEFWDSHSRNVTRQESDEIASLRHFIETEIDRLLKRHLECCLWDRNMDIEKTCFIEQTKFKSEYEVVSILESLIESSLNFIISYNNDNDMNISRLNEKLKTMYEQKFQEQYDKLVITHNALVDDYNELTKLFEEQNDIKELLKHTTLNINVETIEDNNSKTKIKSLEKKSGKITNENQSLKEEIEELRNVISMITKCNKNHTKTNFDFNTKILFVGGYDNLFINLKKVFPNSKHIAYEKDVNYDYINSFTHVVFLTKLMSHGLYYKIKNMLGNNIIIWHTNKKNVDLICKELIGGENK